MILRRRWNIWTIAAWMLPKLKYSGTCNDGRKLASFICRRVAL